ncbi:hypothetical protein PR202_gb11499 [Eleusine coracana subsp. coracana]|uniref:Cupin type-1 domain-containing protein n=1 Tax=Eleusine coracana subsp. coracana TaxID=191504 RepID=A0AAV5ENF2_ELECO|nr:hypothetical protein QOZ80_3BG0267650 [Eleusine coracana subsp. coracana]GJN23815.1 hypothetical protein PR202_gb11499 [Eleusine coracana subsp. coracana]
MATARVRVRTTVPLVLLLLLGTLLFAGAVSSSRERGEQQREQQGRHEWRGEESEEREQQEELSRRKPYVFGRRSFRRAARSEHGTIRSLRPFHEASQLLRGIRDYRVTVLEASPRAFVLPAHTDAHSIGYVVQGEGVVTTIDNGERRSYRVREGSVFVAPAGAVTYLANTDGRRKLVVAKLLHTISVPGHYQFFFGAGGRNPESIVSSFSRTVQRAAFKTSSDRLQKLFGRQDKGVIVRASEQQVRDLQRHASDGGQQHWPFGESRGPINILDQRPSVANRHGQLYEADARSFRDLAEHDVRVSLVNITAGSMSAPFYNTRSIKIAYVVDGEGHAEIVCPHLAQQQQHGSETQRQRKHEGRRRSREREQESQEKSKEEEQWRRRRQEGSESESEEEEQRYETIRARLTRGTVFVVPVGHPVVEVASRDSNLQIVCFEVQAQRNERVYLAGQDSVLKKLDGAAKELAFQASQREVDEVLRAQQDKGFLQGPDQEERRRREGEEERGRRGRREEVAEMLLRMATEG